jgi:hypothetical protein
MWKFPTLEFGLSPPSSESSDAGDADVSLARFPFDLHEEPLGAGPNWLTLTPKFSISPPSHHNSQAPSVAGAGELDLTVPGPRSTAPPNRVTARASRQELGSTPNAQTGARANWHWQSGNAVTGYQRYRLAEYQLPIDEAS